MHAPVHDRTALAPRSLRSTPPAPPYVRLGAGTRISVIESARTFHEITDRADPSACIAVFLVSGACTWKAAGRTGALATGDFVLLPSERCEIVARKPSRTAVVVLDPITARLVAPLPRHYYFERMRSRRSECALVTQYVERIAACAPTLSEGFSSRAEAGLVDLIGGALAASGWRGGRMERRESIRAYIAAHIRDPDLNVRSLARQFACTTRALHAVFRGESLTVQRLIRRRRCEECLRDIESGSARGLSATALARSWGFHDASHMARSLARELGVSSGALRRAIETSRMRH